MSIERKDIVRVITEDEYNALPQGVRNVITYYSPRGWAKGNSPLVVFDKNKCEFNCRDCGVNIRFDFGYAGMDSMCGMLYRKPYSWKKI